jgi:translation elongation factor EF-Tu-like GTPase
MKIQDYMIPTTESTFIVEDVFTVGFGAKARLVATGKADGEIQIGSRFNLFDGKSKIGSGTISQIDSYHKILQKAEPNTPIGISLTGVKKDQIKRGMKIVVG